ncbi:hypothetical protein EIP91_007300 [Steccherinum ochraceum]|uniref:Uncharacterized protein n=1 Tax=Steccherinum ochraceum TaxID=92696 RepID=A0A4R0RA08_9APHY|nr:hypothetical protein EIP91_007300 [Steccherinum ochraceum]
MSSLQQNQHHLNKRCVLFKQTTVKIPSAVPGWNLDAWKFMPMASPTPLPVIIMAHGIGGNKTMGLKPYAEMFANMGYSVIGFDFRHWGASDGSPRNILEICEQLADYKTVVKWCRQQPEFDPHKVILWGASFSGAHVTTLAAEVNFYLFLPTLLTLTNQLIQKSLSIYAVIAQSPYLGAAAALPFGWTFVKTFIHGLLDVLQSMLGYGPHYIDVCAPVGKVAVLNTPGNWDGYCNIAWGYPGADTPNKINASIIFTLRSYQARDTAHEIRCPILMINMMQDTLCMADGWEDCECSIPAGLLTNVTFDGGHFDAYPALAASTAKSVLAVKLQFQYRATDPRCLGKVGMNRAMSKLHDVLLIGYGGVGAMYSHILTKGGRARVTAVARSNYDAVNEHGVDIQSPKYGTIKGFKPHRLCPSVAEAANTDTPYSHVIITTKALPEVSPTSELVAPLLSAPYATRFPQPTYVLVQNGLGVERELYAALKELKKDEDPKLVTCSLYLMMRQIAKNAVKHSALDTLSIGMYRPTRNITRNSPHEQEILENFASVLSPGGTEVVIVPEIQRIKFTKNVWNSVMGPMTVLTRMGARGIFASPDNTDHTTQIPLTAPSPSDPLSDIPAAFPSIARHTIPFIHDAFKEVAALGVKAFPPSPPEDGVEGIGEDIAESVMRKVVNLALKSDMEEKLSILVDAELGRPMEVEVIVGEMVRMGREAGVPMPRLESMYAMMCVIQSHHVYKYKHGRT